MQKTLHTRYTPYRRHSTPGTHHTGDTGISHTGDTPHLAQAMQEALHTRGSEGKTIQETLHHTQDNIIQKKLRTIQ